MLLTSGSYLIFLALFFFVYWPLSARRRPALLVLLLASYYFYALWNPWSLGFLVMISLIDFANGLGIGAVRRQGIRKLLLVTSIIADVGCLFVFKYFNFFSHAAADVLTKFGRPASPALLSLAMPLGLSF